MSAESKWMDDIPHVRRESGEGKKRAKHSHDKGALPNVQDLEEVSNLQNSLDRANQLTTETKIVSEREVLEYKEKIAFLTQELGVAVGRLSVTTAILTPLHLRHLLNLGRQKVAEIFSFSCWEDLVASKKGQNLLKLVKRRLRRHRYRPSSPALKLLCLPSDVRESGNKAAHSGSEDQIRDAIMTSPLHSENQLLLKEVFRFVYEASV
ncbi:hypothetical protein EV401DRAFT_904732 [Pisolithus croceorrhizus]|nr:hypothetical protein EV401DRAFT_904732 [Pisolithus croceorrhizus]